MSESTANTLLPLRLNELPLVGTTPTTSAATLAVALLTGRLAAGDEEAFREFHRIYFDRLYHFLLAVTRGQEQEAQEALQETLLRLLRHPRVFHVEEAFWSWLRAVARNAARDGHRKHRRYFTLLQNFALRRETESNAVGADDVLPLTALLEESLDELNPADRSLVENKYLVGESVREISAGAGLSEKAVESRLLRLRRSLRERILQKLRAP